MKSKKTILIFAMCCTIISLSAQNYVDHYLTDPLTFTTIVNASNSVNQPRDLDFKPNTNELWVANYGNSNGGTIVIVYNAGTPSQTSQFRKDTHSSHFMVYPSAISFSDIGQWGSVGEIQNTNASATSTFMGPSLWISDTSIFGRVFQNNWVNGKPLGSHIDMLHQSPFAMGIAHDSAEAYWVADGQNSDICKYDYVQDHGPGYEDHSAGKIYRYTDVSFTRTPNIPGHMILDKATGWLYYIDSGNKMLRRMNTNTGAISSTLTVPATSNEALAGYWAVTGAVQETIDTFLTQACGIDLYNGRLIVGDYDNGNIYMYDITGASPIFMDTIITGQVGMEGVKIGPDGKIWFVNNTTSNVIRIDVLPSMDDASIGGITSPAMENYLSNFYSTTFDQCSGSIVPSVTLINNGSNILVSATINYSIDNGPVSSFAWTGNLASGSNTAVALPSISPSQGTHVLSVFTSMPNGNPDMNSANDRKDGAFRILNPVSTIPFLEGFSSATFPPAGWSYVHFNPNNEMKRVTNTGGFGNSSQCVQMDNYSGAEDITGQNDYLMTPGIDLSSATNGTTIEFTVAYSQYVAASNDRLFVKVSTDCGATWSTIYNQAGAALATTALHSGAYNAPLATEWRRESVDLTPYLGQSDVIFMFQPQSNYGNNLFIDDIQIMNTTSINSVTQENSINLFPNPTSGSLVIETKIAGSESADIIVTNMLGETIRKTHVISASNGNFQIDLNDCAEGTYFVTVHTDNNVIITRKITIQR